MWKKIHCLAIVLIYLLTAHSVCAWDPELKSDSFLLSPDWQGEVIGAHRFHTAGPKETLMELARDKMLGYTNVKNANPGIDPWFPSPGQVVLLPYSSILPIEANPGITINLAELRLYYIWEENGRFRARTYPVGIGTEGTESPLGQFAILSKIENPTWTVPLSIRKERPESPASVPPGPSNPLGKFWMGFSRGGFGVHGTNIPLGVGRRVSHGCLRLYAQDIQDLFSRAAIGTPLQIINNPIKVGRKNDILFLEVHRDLQENDDELKKEIVRQARVLNWSGTLDWDGIERILKENRGIPFPISFAAEQHSSNL
ncbi:L,D-transpeptidase [Trichloromonas sp.]|uniref:L,D-transpeptidase n=1 Tax=Trichloromonas sp. TaxID=3069249 RepID=UPI003D813F78